MNKTAWTMVGVLAVALLAAECTQKAREKKTATTAPAAQKQKAAPAATPVPGAVPATVKNFQRAESDLYFSSFMKQGGSGKLFHFRTPTPIDKQDIVRMSRDTLYSGGVFDLDAGPVTITLPDAGRRFMSMQTVTEDHYSPATRYAPAKVTRTRKQLGTRYVTLIARTLVSPSDPADVKAVNALQDSTPKWPARPHRLPKDAPNILIVLIDDVGFGTAEPFGGEIHTPTLMRLASEGIRYNAFHTTAICSPTRAALLTGRNHTRVGSGTIAERAVAFDGYTGIIPKSAATVAEVLKHYGYVTSAFGKWHNTPATETTSIGPKDRWPNGYGFDYFYGFLAGESSQWEPAIVENFNRIEAPHRERYHFTEDMADKAVNWIRQQRAIAPDRPFFMYWAPGAVHGPHHIFKEWADKYKGKFDEGWDAMRERVFARQKALGWIPADAQLTPRHPKMAAWADIPAAERPFQARLMEVFAGFLEHTDTQAGRLIDELERLGIRDNTMVLYVWGDNGSSAEGQNGSISEFLAQAGIPTTTADHIRILNKLGGLDALGGPKTDNHYNPGWAWAGSTPYQGTKLLASHLGGTRVPLVVSWPRGVKADATPRSQFFHVIDVVPTVYEAVGIKAPQTVDGVPQMRMDGVSMLPAIRDAKAPEARTAQYFEIMGSRAIYKDGWIARKTRSGSAKPSSSTALHSSSWIRLCAFTLKTRTSRGRWPPCSATSASCSARPERPS